MLKLEDVNAKLTAEAIGSLSVGSAADKVEAQHDPKVTAAPEQKTPGSLKLIRTIDIGRRVDVLSRGPHGIIGASDQGGI